MGGFIAVGTETGGKRSLAGAPVQGRGVGGGALARGVGFSSLPYARPLPFSRLFPPHVGTSRRRLPRLGDAKAALGDVIFHSVMAARTPQLNLRQDAKASP
jgi:hypothetical protein